MIRVLFMIAAAGFVLSVGTLAAAFAIGGPEAVSRGGWTVAGRDWGGNWDWDWDDDRAEVRRGHDDWTTEKGPQVTRTLAWSGAQKLNVELAADVRYVQAAGPASLTVTGPQAAVDHVIVRGDSIRYRSGRHRDYPRLTIVMKAPDITSFDIAGQNTLSIEDYRQSQLNVDISGNAEVTAKGEVDELNLDVSGSGDVDMAALKTKAASVDIAGSGEATIAPTERANLDISGSGDIRLTTRPARLETDISGSGRVHQPEVAPAPVPPAGAKGAKL